MRTFSEFCQRLILICLCLAFPARGHGTGDGTIELEDFEESLTSIIEKTLRYLETAKDKVREIDYERTLKEVKELYEQAQEAGEEVPSDFYEWIREDISRINTWEYTVLVVDPKLRDDLTDRLAKLGKERWECIVSIQSGSEVVVIFKRPARSYLRHVHLKDLLRVLPDGGETEGRGISEQ